MFALLNKLLSKNPTGINEISSKIQLVRLENSEKCDDSFVCVCLLGCAHVRWDALQTQTVKKKRKENSLEMNTFTEYSVINTKAASAHAAGSLWLGNFSPSWVQFLIYAPSTHHEHVVAVCCFHIGRHSRGRVRGRFAVRSECKALHSLRSNDKDKPMRSKRTESKISDIIWDGNLKTLLLLSAQYQPHFLWPSVQSEALKRRSSVTAAKQRVLECWESCVSFLYHYLTSKMCL